MRKLARLKNGANLLYIKRINHDMSIMILLFYVYMYLYFLAAQIRTYRRADLKF